MPLPAESHDAVVAATRHWLTEAVIGLNLCPFAKAVHVKGQIRYAVSDADEHGRRADRSRNRTSDAGRSRPGCHRHHAANRAARARRFSRLQRLPVFRRPACSSSFGWKASFRSRAFTRSYQFEGSEPDDIENYTNRAPYPILHLLREDSIERAVQAFPDAEEIYERNQQTLAAHRPGRLECVDEALIAQRAAAREIRRAAEFRPRRSGTSGRNKKPFLQLLDARAFPSPR